MLSKITTAKNHIKEKTDFIPEIAVVLGSGLGGYADSFDVHEVFEYSDIPGFPVSTAPGHEGKLIFGCKHGRRVALFKGRFHCYEGYSPAETVIPLRTALLLGVKHVLLTNASGGINLDYSAGDLMVVEDHINFSGLSPLTGPNIDELGVRFPDMSYAYSRRLRDILDSIGEEKGIALRHGVYAYMTGPSYETPAEIRALRTLGGDVVGMSTVHEVGACNHAKVEVAALSCISNLAAGWPGTR
jgi:purine-nucleoside phosphorylase